MAIKQNNRGFALLIAVIFMSVMLAFGLALASLSYKQQVLASSAIQSQYAFYAADAGLECALYADQKQQLFQYSATTTPAPKIRCDGADASYHPAAPSNGIYSRDASQWTIVERLSLDSNKRCADITIVKVNGSGTNYIFSQGYDVPCTTVASPSGARFVARGINVRY
jgi:Tfp pilus assembly protein PilX